MSTCVVPGCINLLQEWTAFFPRAPRLVNRWCNAIEVGTGQQISRFQPRDVQICNMHFAVQTQNAAGDAYCEPTLFFREKVLIQIACCELCQKYDMVNDMYKLSERINSGETETLYALARKYFNSPKKGMEAAQYCCEDCVVHIDMTHSFWLKTQAAWKINKREIRLMSQDKIVFRSNRNANGVVVERPPTTTINLDSSDDGEATNAITEEVVDSDSTADAMESFEDSIVKEEPHLATSEQRPPLSTSNETNRTCKCYICNISFPDTNTLTEHIKTVHTGRSRRTCNNCNQTFCSALLLNDHMANHKPYRCNYCPMEFGERRKVIFHEVQHHAGESTKK